MFRVVLTHFSSRYPTMPAMDVAAHPNMAVACDFMTIDLADLPWLPRVTLVSWQRSAIFLSFTLISR